MISNVGDSIAELTSGVAAINPHGIEPLGVPHAPHPWPHLNTNPVAVKANSNGLWGQAARLTPGVAAMGIPIEGQQRLRHPNNWY